MIITANELSLIQHADPDASVEEILQDPEILEKLSESRSFQGPMPSNICFRIENNEGTIGQICIKSIRWINRKAGISLFIKRDMQGKGYGMSSLQAIIEYGFMRLNLFRLEAEVIDGNKASLKLMQQSGFTEEGRQRKAKFVNGVYKDLIIFGLLKEEYLLSLKQDK
ncbi:MAG: GNAT family protein [Bacteroidota bacterium]